jgi:hypothetical protein
MASHIGQFVQCACNIELIKEFVIVREQLVDHIDSLIRNISIADTEELQLDVYIVLFLVFCTILILYRLVNSILLVLPRWECHTMQRD